MWYFPGVTDHLLQRGLMWMGYLRVDPVPGSSSLSFSGYEFLLMERGQELLEGRATSGNCQMFRRKRMVKSIDSQMSSPLLRMPSLFLQLILRGSRSEAVNEAKQCTALSAFLPACRSAGVCGTQHCS